MSDTIYYYPGTPYTTYMLRWTCHGNYNCPKCQALDGVTKPAGEWQISPGFHPHCDCTLDLVGWEEYSGEPVLYVPITYYPIIRYAQTFNPVKSPNPPILFPLCPFISNLPQIARSPFAIIPQPIPSVPKAVTVPTPTNPPKPYVATSLKRFG